MFWKWLTIIGLSVSPALVAGRSAALVAGIAWELNVPLLLVVVAISSFVGNVLVMYLADLSARIRWLKRLLSRFHTERAIRWVNRWGPWGGMLLGVAVVGPIPILIALKYMKLETRPLLAPTAVSCVVYTLIWYGVAISGMMQLEQASELRQTWDMLWDHLTDP